jgi:response regulator of citrate/malate metabolism
VDGVKVVQFKVFLFLQEGWEIFTVEIYLRVRQAHFADGLSGREIARQFGISRDSVRKMLMYGIMEQTHQIW